MHTTFLTLGRHGRLGNQLFQIAATIGTARRNGCEYVFPLWNYSSFFRYRLPQAEDIHFDDTHVEKEFRYTPINIECSTNLWGYFQSEKYFQHCENEIRHFFTPGEQLNSMLVPFREEIFRDRDATTICSVCVRRCEYVELNWLFTELARTTFYAEAFERMGKNTQFIIFSDDIPWCREYFDKNRYKEYRLTFVEPPHELVGLFLMASCRNHILANSTFAWWGAWLNPRPEKRVIAPVPWFVGPAMDRDRPYCDGGFHDTCDLLPESWERIVVDPFIPGKLPEVAHV